MSLTLKLPMTKDEHDIDQDVGDEHGWRLTMRLVIAKDEDEDEIDHEVGDSKG